MRSATMMTMVTEPVRLVRVTLMLVAMGALLSLNSCRVVEGFGDTMAGVTAGTPVAPVFSGMARAAESFREYSPSEEHYIGRAVGAEILARYRVADDQALADYVNLVGLSIALGSSQVKQTFSGYHFVILEGDEVNAISAPGGFVFLTRGTIRRARSEEELAAILAHEIAHVSLGHGVGAIKAATRKRSLALITQGVGQTASEIAREGGSAEQQAIVELTATFADAVQQVTGELLEKGYSRDQELEADRMAAGYLREVGYNARGLLTYLQGMGAAGGRGGWFNTHPAAAERVRALGVLVSYPQLATGEDVRSIRFRAHVSGKV